MGGKLGIVSGITGVCGVRVEAIEEPLTRDIRYLDKLIERAGAVKADGGKSCGWGDLEAHGVTQALRIVFPDSVLPESPHLRWGRVEHGFRKGSSAAPYFLQTLAVAEQQVPLPCK